MKVLIVYYSWTGATGQIARMIQQELGGDLEKLQAAYDQDSIGYPVLSKEITSRVQAKYHAVKHDPGHYDLVIIGTPVWGFNISSPVRAYLMGYHGELQAVAFFVVCDVSGTSKVLRDMEGFSGLRPRARLEINDVEMKSGTHLEKVRSFVRELQEES